MLTQAKERELQNFAREIRIQNHPTDWDSGIWTHRWMYVNRGSTECPVWGGHEVRSPKSFWEDRTGLVCSKGHAGPAIYAALALKGFFPMEWMETLNQPGTNLPSHCDRRKTPGIDMTTGSLGQGLSIAAGIAQAHLFK